MNSRPQTTAVLALALLGLLGSTAWAQNSPTTATITSTIELESGQSYGGVENQRHVATADALFTGVMVASDDFAEQSNSADDGNTDLDTTIASVNSQQEFVLTDGNAADDYYTGATATKFESGGTGPTQQREYFLVTDYVGATKTITVDRAATFNADAGDVFRVYFDPQWTHQGSRHSMRVANLDLDGGGTATGGIHLFGHGYLVSDCSISGINGTALIADRGATTRNVALRSQDFDFPENAIRDIVISDSNSGFVIENYPDGVCSGKLIAVDIHGGTGFTQLSDGNLAPLADGTEGVAFLVKKGSWAFNGTLHCYGVGYGLRIPSADSHVTINDAYLENSSGAALYNVSRNVTLNHLYVHTAGMWIDEPIVYSSRRIKILSGEMRLTDTTGYGGHIARGALIEGAANGSVLDFDIRLADEACTGLTIRSNGVHYRGSIIADNRTAGQVGIELANGVSNCVIEVVGFNIDTAVKLNAIGHNNKITVTDISGTVTTEIDTSLAGEGHGRIGSNGEPKNIYEIVDTAQ